MPAQQTQRVLRRVPISIPRSYGDHNILWGDYIEHFKQGHGCGKPCPVMRKLEHVGFEQVSVSLSHPLPREALRIAGKQNRFPLVVQSHDDRCIVDIVHRKQLRKVSFVWVQNCRLQAAIEEHGTAYIGVWFPVDSVPQALAQARQ